MPHIIPIKDLKKASEISELCRNLKEPIYITKNGYGDMVIMSMETYEKSMLNQDLYPKLEKGEDSIKKGLVRDGLDSLAQIRKKYEL